MTIRRPRKRRGIVLLIVLSMLVLFLLIGVTFVVVADNYTKSAVINARMDATRIAPEDILDDALFQMLRGPAINNSGGSNSSLMRHDLLGDIYGPDHRTGRIQQVAPVSSNPARYDGLTVFTIKDVRDATGASINPADGLIQFHNHLAGQTITFLDHPVRTARILRTIDKHSGDFDAIVIEQVPNLRINTPFLINGRPLSGNGAHSQEVAATNSQMYDSSDPVDFARLPHYRAVHDLFNTQPADMNESHDAVDLENMLLAKVPRYNPSNNNDKAYAQAYSDGLGFIPSLHRPGLLKYWWEQELKDVIDEHVANKSAAMMDRFRNRLRSIMLRPSMLDHPNFTGSNPSLENIVTDGNYVIQRLLANNQTLRQEGADVFFQLFQTLVNGPFDVDNDVDGVAESVWIDAGFPVQQTDDGRIYKPLVAILCQDLGGRLNVNAHDSYASIAKFVGAPANNLPLRDLATNMRNNGANNPMNNPLLRDSGVLIANAGGSRPRGFGYGPADVSLGNAVTNVRTVLKERYRNPRLDIQESLPGFPFGAGDQGEFSRYLDGIFSLTNDGGNPFVTATDLHARGSIALDRWGLPIYGLNGTSRMVRLDNEPAARRYLDQAQFLMSENSDSPYDANPIPGESRGDSPFTYKDLERVLRFRDYDLDELPIRLKQYVQNSAESIVTTASFELPVPTVDPFELMDDQGLDRITDANVISHLLAPELQRGERMNLNRPFGNRLDDDGDRSIDESMEANAYVGPQHGTIPNSLGNYQNHETVDNVGPKQIYARHLYIAALMGANEDFELPLEGPEENDTNASQRRALFAQRVAQWAVNAVDFRDDDGAMTAFEYDIDPWDGWDIDDNIETDEGGDRRVAWGCEYPELMLTETLAFHNRRVRDTDQDSSGEKRWDNGASMTADEDLDQWRIPQGSLFVELYSPRSPDSVSGLPSDLYAGANLLLSKMAPNNAPVWKLAISERHARNDSGDPIGDDRPERSPQRLVTKQDTAAFEAERTSLVRALDDGPLDIEREVWFVRNFDPNNLPSNYPKSGVSFFYLQDRPGGVNANAPVTLERGEKLVVAPRLDTSVGDVQDQFGSNPRWGTIENNLAWQQFEVFDDNGRFVLRHWMHDPLTGKRHNLTDLLMQRQGGTPGAQPQRVPHVVVASANLTPGTASSRKIGLNISEPDHRNYYTVPSGMGDIYTDPLDEPEDFGNLDSPLVATMGGSADEAQTVILQRTGAKENFRTVFLQRLANPNAEWHPIRNPYRTVDWMSIDLHVFNADDRSDRAGTNAGQIEGMGEQFDILPAVPNAGLDMGTDDRSSEELVSRERGTSGRYWTFLSRSEKNAKSMDPRMYGKTMRGFNDGDYSQLYNELRLLKFDPTPFDGSDTTSASTAPTQLSELPLKIGHSLGYINDSVDRYVEMGIPTAPFPWISWHNRPFISKYELMMVPAATPARLAHEFAEVNPQMLDDDGRNEYRGRFPHLINFLPTDIDENEIVDELFEVFDLVEVPSRFFGSRRWFDTGSFSQVASMYSPFNRNAAKFGLEVPFHYASSFRYPGLVNINTIFDKRVADAVFGNRGASFWKNFVESRRGHDTDSDAKDPDLDFELFDDTRPPRNWDYLNEDFPTQYGNPFRSIDRSIFSDEVANAVDEDDYPFEEHHASILRDDDRQRPLMIRRKTNTFENSDYHPYFYYEDLARLGNLTTNQSHVYAVWITVGYFEVESMAGRTDEFNRNAQEIHRDGYRLGRELGSETGDVRRHRAFYILDRSIPVGYEPGKSHNVQDCIMLRRILE